MRKLIIIIRYLLQGRKRKKIGDKINQREFKNQNWMNSKRINIYTKKIFKINI